jgi:1-phosphofructokinase family hexose kinase
MAGRLVCVAANPAIDRLVEVERLVPGSIHRPTFARAVAGGKGLNVARAAAALGAEVVAVGLLGGHMGRWVAETLAADGVVGRFATIAGETRIVTSIADHEAGSLTELYEVGPQLDASAWASLERELDDVLADGSALVAMSGSLPPGAPPDGYARLVRLANEAGIPAAVDPGATLATAVAAQPWLAQANAGEAGRVTGKPVDDDGAAIAAARSLLDRGAGNAVVTRGLDGAVAIIDGAVWRLGPPPERGPYPVGSGDAFLAGLAVGHLDGLDTPATLALAAGAAAANALEPGAGVLDADLARRLAGTVVVDRVG